MLPETSLPQFLSDIGAAELPSKVSLDGETVYARHRARLDKEVEAVQLRIHRTLQDNQAALARQQEATRDITSRIESAERDLREVDGQLHHPQTGLHPILLDTLQRHADLARATAARATTVQALKLLKGLIDGLAALQAAQTAGRLDEACDKLLALQEIVNTAPVWLRQDRVWRRCEARLEGHKSQVVESLLHLAFQVAIVERTDNEQERTLTILPNVSSVNAQLSLAALLTSIDKLGLLERHLRRLATTLIDHFVAPCAMPLPMHVETDGDTLRIAARSHSESALARLTTIVSFLSPRLLSAIPSSHRSTFDAIFTAPLCELVVNDILSSALPSSLSIDPLKDFQLLLTEATTFEIELQRLGFATTGVITSWVADVGSHWAQRVSERVVQTIRTLVVKAQWETVVVESKPGKLRKATRGGHRAQRSSVDLPPSSSNRSLPTGTTSPRSSLQLEREATSPKVMAETTKRQSLDLEEDAWGLEEEPSSPVQTSPDASHIRADATAAQAPATTATPEAPTDAWGFDEDDEEMPAVPVASTSKLSNGRHSRQPSATGGDDAWGFDEDDDALVKPVTPKSPKSPVKPTSAAEGDDDGWDLDPPLTPSVPASPVKPKHAKRDSMAAWGWEGDEEDDGAQETKKQPIVAPRMGKPPNRARRKPELGAVPVNATVAATERRNVQTETFTISTSTRQVLAVAADLLSDARKLQAVDLPLASLAQAAQAVQHTSLDVLDYFRATMAVQHAQLLDSVPALAMQFANDCEWLAREVADLELEEDVTLAFTALAKSVRENQLNAQRIILAESLDDAGQFRSTSNEARFLLCERAIRQVTHTLERLSHVWKPPSLTRRMYDSSMGDLVNGVLARVLDEIEDQDDISEEDSKRLNQLCKMLHNLESLFTDGATSTIALHVPLWFKFVFLSELLEASMVDIMFLYEEGHLVDFSSTELIKLVRALFAESPNRAKAIESIRAGRAG